MSSKNRMTRSFRSASAAVYLVSDGGGSNNNYLRLLPPTFRVLKDFLILMEPLIYLFSLAILLCQADIIAALIFASQKIYLNILIGILVFLACLTMLFVTIEAPPFVLKILDTKRFSFLFTFRGRYLIDLVVSLFLFGMGVFGIVMGAITLALIFGIRFIGVKNPESFSELFRQPLSLDDDDETFVTYDGATLGSAEET